MKKLLQSITKEEWLIATAVGLLAYLLYSNSGKGGSAKNTRKSVKNKNPKSILILGDSYSVSPPAFTWSSLVKKDLAEKGITVDVIAKSGETTEWMLKKLTEALKTKKYDRIYVWGGTNDAVPTSPSIPTEKIIGNFQKMSDLAKENNSDLFILKGYVFDGYFSIDKLMLSGYKLTREQWEQVSRNIKNIKAKLNKDNIKNVNFVEEFNLGDKTGDGSHPNGEAHKIIAKAVLETI